MEDEEDIQSQNSGESGSPATSRSDGRITVTVASVPPSSSASAAQGALTLALPSQQPIQQQQQQQHPQQLQRSGGKSGGGGGSGGREDCWSEGATSVLIDAWGERYLELSRGNLKQNHWKDVADIVGSRDNSSKTPKTDIQCKNRIDTVKKKYKMEKAKIAAGGGPSKWPFYDRLDRLIGSTAKGNSSGGGGGGGSGSGGGMNSSQRGGGGGGIPFGARSNPNSRNQHLLQKHKPPIRKRPVASDSESEPELSPDSADDFPPVTYDRNKRPRSRNQNDFGRPGGTNSGKDVLMEKRGGGGAKDKNFGNSVKDLAWAIVKFGEAYEQAESSKLQQLVDMEKQRMKFAKELEVQRMQFFMKTQLELSQLNNNNNHRRSSNGRSNHHRSSINNNVDHSDSSN